MSNQRSIRERSGVASIPVILVLMILIIAIGVGVTVMSISEALVAEGQKQSAQALLFAEAGARDALERLARDKTYSCAAANCYSIDFTTNGCSANTGCAQVSVSAASGTAANPKVVTSTGQMGSNTRKIEVDVIFDVLLNGEIATTTWREVTQ